jgi:hypothetical protein
MEMSAYSQFKLEQRAWSYVYCPCVEEEPIDPPQPLGKCMIMTTFVDANLIYDMVMGRNVTGSTHLLNNTPIEWCCKKKNTVETTAFGSEFVAVCIMDFVIPWSAPWRSILDVR